MEKIGILLDSTTLTRENIGACPFVKVAPLNVTIDGIGYSEFELTTEAMLKHLRTAKKMTTSQPSPGEFLNLYKQFLDEGYTHVLVITLSEKISGTFQSALIAKSMVEFPLEISVHAPRVASFGVANGVAVLIDMVKEGIGFDALLKNYYAIFTDSQVMFTLANLMHLFHGGRLSRIQALLGTVLRIKPIVEMIDGKLQLTKKERTNIACYEYFLQAVDDYVKKHEKTYLDIIHLNRLEWAEKLKEEVLRRYPDVKIHITDYVSPVFFVHLGDQGFGIALAGK